MLTPAGHVVPPIVYMGSFTCLEKTTKQAQEKFHCRQSLNRYNYVACTNESDLKTYESLKVIVRHLSVRPYVCSEVTFYYQSYRRIPMCLEQSRFKEIPIWFGVVSLYSYSITGRRRHILEFHYTFFGNKLHLHATILKHKLTFLLFNSEKKSGK